MFVFGADTGKRHCATNGGRMSTRVRWLLVVILGLMAYLQFTTFAVANASPFQNDDGFTTNLIPFGQLTYDQVANIAFIEWLLVVILWAGFAILLLRRSGE
jgi:hypothetical protein